MKFDSMTIVGLGISLLVSLDFIFSKINRRGSPHAYCHKCGKGIFSSEDLHKPTLCCYDCVSSRYFTFQRTESCFCCRQKVGNDKEFHKNSGYCFSCISKREDVLIDALNADRRLKSKYGFDRRLYDIYITSNKWKGVRQNKIKASEGKCFNCGATKNLQVHHKTYDSLGKEDLYDIVVLCTGCHDLLHTSRGKIKVDELEEYFKEIDEYLKNVNYELNHENQKLIK